MLTQILVVDDEPQILRALKTILTANQFKVTTASTGTEALTLAAAQPPDVIILDLSLPDMDGLMVCEELRAWTQVPIIILSVRDSEKEKVKALDKGADDYLTKPFGIEELLARIRVALKHASQVKGIQQTIITSGALVIDLSRHLVTLSGKEIKLTATEFRLAAYLASNADRVLTHQAILSYVWGFEDSDHTEYLRVFIGQLRKKIENNPNSPKYIVTEPGVGYRFITYE
ncbi:response regulator transcription factor [Flexilinea flocculi]|jgi:two-component system KDP operon response regulator KdpE|uniref:DNA-binding response regulator, OmpR family n=1 Tax=Flexilinea flocculi TaxID=1678840 RepID=A0A0S7BL29_9CHLR|nr:response regulator transcription factor [Flexilinea flocculi]NMB93514.1 response regulator transcription factor [Flexilinea flocculi]GAP41052.1 DNA-binding response regulator, OmpR family [Flexilinea flocculi]